MAGPSARSSRLLVPCGFALTFIYVAALLKLMGSTHDGWVAFVLGPVLLAVSVPRLAAGSARLGNRRLFWLLLAALTARLLGAIARHYVAFDVYGGLADATGYHMSGIREASELLSEGVPSSLPKGTNFIELVTGIVYLLFGPTLLGGFLFFSWLGFWGTFLFYRAFTIAVPEGRHEGYARLLFFLPTMVFWPSGIGKDAWMVLALGIAAYGAAQVLSGRTNAGVALCALGLWLSAMVRPHIAAMVALSLAVGWAVRRRRRVNGLNGFVAAGLILAAAAFFVTRAQSYLEASNVDTSEVAAVLAETNRRTAQGGSEFEATVIKSPADVPVAFVTVMFRPLVVEARSPQALLAAAEGTFLLLLSLTRWRSALALLRSIRRQPYVALALVFVGLTTFAFSAIANFGILVRQRAQVLPFFLVLLAGPLVRRSGRQGQQSQLPMDEERHVSAHVAP